VNTLPYLVVELPLPPEILHPNDKGYTPASRGGKFAKSAATKKARGDASIIFNARRRAGKIATREAVRWRPIFYFKVIRARDDDNLTKWLKAYRDGFADAFLIMNDSGIRNADPVQRIDKRNQRVVIEIFDDAKGEER